nr:uncharacterized protein LOC125183798 [Anser cygnoides]
MAIKALLLKSHQESMSCMPSIGDPDVIGEEQHGTSVQREPSRTSQARSWTAASTPGHHLKDRSRTKMGTSKGGKAMVGLLLTITAVIGYCQPWVSIQPRRNIWVTLANMTGQEAMCLSRASANDPFTTCLVGNPADNKDCTVYLPQAPLEPQELDILGCVTATACVRFNCSGKKTNHETNGQRHTVLIAMHLFAVIIQNFNSILPCARSRSARLWDRLWNGRP